MRETKVHLNIKHDLEGTIVQCDWPQIDILMHVSFHTPSALTVFVQTRQ
jgi:hypothetical protein